MRTADRRFEVAFETAVVGLSITDAVGRYLEVNEALADMLGRPRETLIGMTIDALTAPEDRAFSAEVVRGAIAGTGPERFAFEKRFLRPDGTTVPTLLSGALVRDEHGAPSYFTAQIVDLSERKAAEAQVAAARRRVELVLGSLPGTVVTLYDADLRLIELAGSLPQVPDPEVQRRRPHFAEIVPPAAYARIAPRMLAALAGERSSFEHLTADGTLLAIDVVPFREHGEDGAITAALCVWRDVTEHRARERAGREADRRLQIAFDLAPIGMAIISLDGRFVQVNGALCAMAGRDADALLADDPIAMVHPDDRAPLRQAMGTIGQGSDTGVMQHRVVRADGTVRWVEARATLVRDDDGEPVHLLAQQLDITERREHEAALSHLAHHDPLTGVANRRAFDAQLACAAAGAVMLVDVDGLKAVNDTLGHAAGDRLLADVAAALTDGVRDADLLARLGGDEFGVLLPGIGRAEAEAIAARLVEAVRARTTGTVCVGVRMIAPGEPAERAVADADAALYAVKRDGRDGWRIAEA